MRATLLNEQKDEGKKLRVEDDDVVVVVVVVGKLATNKKKLWQDA